MHGAESCHRPGSPRPAHMLVMLNVANHSMCVFGAAYSSDWLRLIQELHVE